MLINSLRQGPLKSIRLQSNVCINKQEPIAGDLLDGPAAGPVLADPALVGRSGARLDQAEP